jgi:exosortase/archaeosortase family protein
MWSFLSRFETCLPVFSLSCLSPTTPFNGKTCRLESLALLFGKLRVLRTIAIVVIGFAGAFLINIVRLLVAFLTFEWLGEDAGSSMHLYFGYLIFFAWVMVFWLLVQKLGVSQEGSTDALPQRAPQRPECLCKLTSSPERVGQEPSVDDDYSRKFRISAAYMRPVGSLLRSPEWGLGNSRPLWDPSSSMVFLSRNTTLVRWS